MTLNGGRFLRRSALMPIDHGKSTGYPANKLRRKARNPRTGDKVFVPEKYVVTFKPGKEMEERVRLLEEAAAKAAGA